MKKSFNKECKIGKLGKNELENIDITTKTKLRSNEVTSIKFHLQIKSRIKPMISDMSFCIYALS